MGKRQLSVSERVYNRMAGISQERLSGFLESQMIANGFDATAKHEITHDQTGHRYIITQECTGDDIRTTGAQFVEKVPAGDIHFGQDRSADFSVPDDGQS